MKFLIDTHCWIWCFTAPEKLNESAQKMIVDHHNDIFLSVASIWEIVIKYSLGKLHLPLPPREYIPERLAKHNMTSLPIVDSHVMQVGELPNHHRDPFDRLLVAQAIVEKIPILTADAKLKKYNVKIIWGGLQPSSVTSSTTQ